MKRRIRYSPPPYSSSEASLKADWPAKNFKMYRTFSASNYAVLPGKPGGVLDVFPNRRPFQLALRVYTGVHQREIRRRINLLGVISQLGIYAKKTDFYINA